MTNQTEMTDSWSWMEILREHPEKATECPYWDEFTSVEWMMILEVHPQFADRCPWENGVLKRAAHGSHCTPRKIFEYTHSVVADNVEILEKEFARKGLQVFRVGNK